LTSTFNLLFMVALFLALTQETIGSDWFLIGQFPVIFAFFWCCIS